MGFYTESGFLDFRAVRDKGFPFNIIIGGRGSGKTYGALLSSVEDGKKFCFMRRRQTQLDLINKPEFSPIKPICRDTGLHITMRPIAKGLSAFVPYETDEDGKEIPAGAPYGWTVALSTVSNIRGFDASDVELLIYDEAIPEKGELPIPHEAEKLFNCYETMNRNRELEGSRPLQLFCLANANDQTAPILEHLRLIRRLDRMLKTGTELWTDPDRGLLVLVLRDSPVSEAKRDTALYRLTAGSEFSAMALDNAFSYEDRVPTSSRPLAEYRPLVTVGEITIYKHKSSRSYYVSGHRTGSPPTFGTGDTALEQFRRAYGYLAGAWYDGRIDVEDYLAQVLLTKYLL